MKNKVSKDSLGDRMKDIENRTRYYLPRRTYTILRLDGRSFSTFTKDCIKPFDPYFIQTMQYTAKALCQEIMGAKIGYTQSDEISLVLTDFDDVKTEAFFDGNIQKICSIAASIGSVNFNTKWQGMQAQKFEGTGKSYKIKLGCFDCRVYSTPDPWEVYNAFYWRQQDCVRNSISCLAQSLYSSKELHKKNSIRLKEMIIEKGQSWDDQPAHCKYGSFIIKDTGWRIDNTPPMINKNKKYLFENIPVLQSNYEIAAILNGEKT